ncbi:hypothetical protein GCM10007972_17250 [Iodidimonas muriae]|uniref:Secreted protein n=1 Tax=Iodidimonas muriae TaxID=261467 RepID=A0ABQ2LDJ5_9PROT|nr:hypothetical protein GCM10007972_17250 [Iodidimonas muriae]
MINRVLLWVTPTASLPLEAGFFVNDAPVPSLYIIPGLELALRHSRALAPFFSSFPGLTRESSSLLVERSGPADWTPGSSPGVTMVGWA